MTIYDIYYRRILYVLAAALPVFGAAAEAGLTLGPAVWFAAAASSVIALRAFEDTSRAEVPANPISTVPAAEVCDD